MPRLILIIFSCLQGICQTLASQVQSEKPVLSIKVEDDYLALHVKGTAPEGTTALEYRVTTRNAKSAEPAWHSMAAPDDEGSFRFEIPLPDWRWSLLEVRALSGTEQLAAANKKPKVVPLEILTPERIQALSEPERQAWKTYLELSEKNAAFERASLAQECINLGLNTSKPAPKKSKEFEYDHKVQASWYASEEAAKLAVTVRSYQTPTGGWSKAVDYNAGPREPGTQWTTSESNPWHYCATLDNRSTTEQIEFLVNVHAATGNQEAKQAAERGIEWLLMAQFPNGGWPQVYPIEAGYHEAITINDGAMIHALEILRSVMKGKVPYHFIDDKLRLRCTAAFEKGVACLLQTQAKINGSPTVWCAQHDPLTLAPVSARLKEPVSLSGLESAEVLRFLIRQGTLRPELIAAVNSGTEWLSAHRISGLRKTKNDDGQTNYIQDEASTEVYWARFYDVKTGAPIFAGAEDGKIYNSFHEMAQQNKVTYDYFTQKPASLLEKDLKRWQQRLSSKR